MTLKQLIAVLVLVAALAIGDIVVRLGQKGKNLDDVVLAANSKRGKSVFPELPVENVAFVTITKKDGAVNLKKEGGQWLVADRGAYPANFPDIRSLLVDIANLKITGTENVDEKHFGMFGLEDPKAEKSEEDSSATHVELAGDNGAPLASVFIGKEPGAGGSPNRNPGTESKSIYVRVKGKDGVLLVTRTAEAIQPPPGGFPVSALSDWLRYATEPSDWIDKAFFNVSNPNSIDVKHPDPAESWKVVLGQPEEGEEDGEWEFAEPEPGKTLDIDSKASGIRYLLTNPTFRDVLAADEAGALNWSKESTVAKIATDDGFKYELMMIKTKPEEGESSGAEKHYLKVNVNADLPDKRPPVEGESDEDKAKKDADYAAKLPRLRQKLKKEQAFNDRVFEVSEYVLSTLLKKRSEISTEAKPEEPEEPAKPNLPTDPAEPTNPAAPDTPTEPAKPEDPGKATEPATPTDPAKPEDPDKATEPATPADPNAPEDPTPGKPEADPNATE